MGALRPSRGHNSARGNVAGNDLASAIRAEGRDSVMLVSARRLWSYRIIAKDGCLGTVRDLYLSDATWEIIAVVVGAGTLLRRRRLLVSPDAIAGVERSDRVLRLTLSTEEVKRRFAPAAGGKTGASAHRGAGARMRSARRLIGFRVQAADARAGHLSDLLADLQEKTVPVAVVALRRWLWGYKRRLRTKRIQGVLEARRTVFLDVSSRRVRDAAEHSPSVVEFV
jgi:hypothetical protein